jgi:nitrogen fixation protein NifB
MVIVSSARKLHPCFDEDAHDSVGRVHLPVARACNIQCNFCDRRVCANLEIQHPGWTAKVMTPEEAAALVRSMVRSGQDDFVVGVAGPGEPLANEETFRALSIIHAEYPWLTKCVSTNGLLLEERLPDLVEVGVKALTVTVNAPDSIVGTNIYSWVRYHGVVYRGKEAADILLERQFHGIKAALSAGLRLKVNCVLVPGINDSHMVRLARLLRNAGVPLMNIMPLIPGGQMKDLRAPTCDEIRGARDACSALVTQFRRCEQCRADIIRMPRH